MPYIFFGSLFITELGHVLIFPGTFGSYILTELLPNSGGAMSLVTKVVTRRYFADEEREGRGHCGKKKKRQSRGGALRGKENT